MMGKALPTILITLFFAVLILGAFLLGGILFPESRVVTPRIDPVNSDQPAIQSTTSYPFENGIVTFSVLVNRSVYEGAKKADKSVTIIGNVSENVWITDSYRAMVNDPAQEGIYQDLIVKFREVKAARNLDDDEYLELIAVYVQSLRYETIGENPAKFPVETVVDQAGDCDDKSLLLAGLLSREGYSVALLSFRKENHMAVGVASRDYRYTNTNYTFLETTNVSFVGIPTEKLESGIILHSSPITIPIGSGSKSYTRGAETAHIHESLIQSKQKAEELEPQLKSMQAAIEVKQMEIRDIKTRMQSFRNAGRIQDYNSLVSAHNDKVSAYNAELNSYKTLFSDYEDYVTIHNYILEHEYDRKGVYQYIVANMPA
jgi:hypothetical protein